MRTDEEGRRPWMSKVLPNGTIILDTPEDIAFARLVTLQSALRLEARGMRLSRGVSALKIAKTQYGCTGGRQKVMQQVDALVERAKKDRLQP